MTKVADEITEILKTKFNPSRLEVINESHLHAGHAGDDGSGESHFRVVIKADAFTDASRVACHRMVYSALDSLLKERIHALALEIMKP
jgi:BolA protein